MHVLLSEGLRAAEAAKILGNPIFHLPQIPQRLAPAIVDTADGLLQGMRAAAGDGTPLFLDIPHANRDALTLANAQLDEPVFETARMYRGGRPPEDVSRVFGVTTFELG